MIFYIINHNRETNVSEEALLQDMKILSQLITLTNTSISRNDMEKLHGLLEENEMEVDVLLEKLAPKCEKLIDKCKWKGEEKGCRTLFVPQTTSNGFCCSFNYYGTDKGDDNVK